MILCIDSFLKDRQVYLASILAYVTTLISSLQYPVFKVLRAGFLRPVASATRESRKAVLSSRVVGASRGNFRNSDFSSQDVHISSILYINRTTNHP